MQARNTLNAMPIVESLAFMYCVLGKSANALIDGTYTQNTHIPNLRHPIFFLALRIRLLVDCIDNI